MKPSQGLRRSVARTVLVVGEGQSEELFLRHLCSLYQQRGSGVRITIKNARGKGAQHVVDYAIRQSRNADFDERVALLDTDVGWNATTQNMARKGRIEVLQATPCLEAVLLQIHGYPVENRTTAQLKQAFEAAFGASASASNVFAQHFNAKEVEAARTRLPVLGRLLTLLQTGK
ncbi:hypothetical protein [Acidovorax sp.]|uniref:hypothetical protein n=1 Tax=Acidovorax sp. TaxID=1872122 RepID=UPI002ACE6877|nr:hypothetical protein [Acidovorax sp.]MDZ7862223.1 hypothetical protein [Acidovorax sp.]